MFKPDTNTDRLNYGEILLPPVGYQLVKAVGTTYSLDLEALISISVSLGLLETTDSKISNNPVILLNAFQKVSDKIMIFCEDGQIKLPNKPSPLSIILEKMIVPVALPKRNGFTPSFHAKTWMLEYGNEKKDKIYRFVVLSRNLTFDHSWDVSFSMDGVISKEPDESTKPIVDFLDFLKKNIGSNLSNYENKCKFVNSLKNDISHASFSLNSKWFEDFEILPLGIGKKGIDINVDPLFTESYHDFVVVSPFVSGTTIGKLCGWSSYKELTNCKKALITRKSELSKLTDDQVNNCKIYTLKDTVIDGESIISDDSVKMSQDIHAKMFLRRKGSSTDLYLGSMNATYAAANYNVEMLIKLSGKNRYLNYDILMNDLFCGDENGPKNPFERVSLSEDVKKIKDDPKQDLERILKDICRYEKTACVIQKDNGKYKININISNVPETMKCEISPLLSNKTASLSKEVCFDDLDLLQISEFYRIKVSNSKEKIERVILIPTSGLPDEREIALVNDTIKEKRDFIEYIAFILADDYILSLLEKEQLDYSGIFKQSPDLMPALYEKMLRVSYSNPSKLKEIDHIVSMVTKEDVIPKEFRDTYETFKKTLKL